MALALTSRARMGSIQITETGEDSLLNSGNGAISVLCSLVVANTGADSGAGADTGANSGEHSGVDSFTDFEG